MRFLNRNITVVAARVSVVVLFFAAAGFLSGFAAGAEEPRITVRGEVDRDSVTIGDKIKYTITVVTEKDMEVRFPDFPDTLGNFTVRDFGSKERRFFGKKTFIKWYLLDTYASGTQAIPGAVVDYRQKGEEEWHQAKADEIEIEVKSVLNDEAADIRDIKGPVNLPRRMNPYVIASVIAGILIIGLLWFLITKRKKKKKIIPTRPAHEIAFERLRALKSKDYIGQGRIKIFYGELSLIVRHYLEDRFALRAPEMTTEEFLAMLKGAGQLSRGHKGLLRDFLFHCDLVKFAKYGPTENEIDKNLISAENLVEQTKNRIEN